MDHNPVQFSEVTNRESFSPIFSLNDDDTGDLIDLTGITIQLEVRKFRSAHPNSGGYGTSFGYGACGDSGPVLSASIGNGITVIDTGTVQLFFSETQMRALDPATYSIACTISDGLNTRQLFLGRLPVLDGMVTV